MRWTKATLAAGIVLVAAGISLVIERDVPARAAATDLQAIAREAQLRSGTPMAPAVFKPKFDTGLFEDAHAFAMTPPPVERVVTVARGDTLMKLLTKNGVDRSTAHRAIQHLTKVYDVRRLQIGQDIVLTFQAQSGGERFLGLALQPNAEREVLVTARANGDFTAQEIKRALERQDSYASAEITSSLYVAALDAGMPIDVLSDLVRVFSFDVDFQRDIQVGDRVEVLFDTFTDELGNPVRTGDIRYASMTLSGKTLSYYHYTPKSGVSDYFDAKGRSVRKTLMRTPIDGARLSSGFGMRKHPILGYTKMHKGTDFAARTGTPIMAAGDGVVEFVGRKGAYGKYIRIRHNSALKTAYAHLSKYARGMKSGARVKQGQTIGYVGSTGRSTGPHLHYEVLVNGRQKNPMSVKLPAGEKLKGGDLKKFEQFMPAIDQRVAAARGDTEVASR